MKKRVAIFASHVIQYQDPLFRRLAAHPEIDLTVLFGSRSGAERFVDRDMGVELTWDLDAMLTGYRHRFLRNISPVGLHGRVFRLVNPGIVPLLWRERFDAFIPVAGWGVATTLLACLTCIARGTPFFLYGDASFIPKANSLRARVRDRFVRWLFSKAAGFMVLGTMNADYYRHYGADDDRLFFMPYAIDNERFARDSRISDHERQTIRARFGASADLTLILFSGKLMGLKNPSHLLDALERMSSRERAGIVYIGDGPLRTALEEDVHRRGLTNVFFTGFVNQKEIPKVMGAADIFVLPSSRDQRGTVVNEAMACGLPPVITDGVGIYGEGDLVRHEDNGFVYPVGDVERLAAILDRLVLDASLRRRMGERSREIIATWDFEADVRGVLDAVHSVEPVNRAVRESKP